jgi:hypothetical protein
MGGLCICLQYTTTLAAGQLHSVALVKGATLKVYPGASHGLCSTHKNQVNADLLAYIKAQRGTGQARA